MQISRSHHVACFYFFHSHSPSLRHLLSLSLTHSSCCLFRPAIICRRPSSTHAAARTPTLDHTPPSLPFVSEVSLSRSRLAWVACFCCSRYARSEECLSFPSRRSFPAVLSSSEEVLNSFVPGKRVFRAELRRLPSSHTRIPRFTLLPFRALAFPSLTDSR